MRWIRAYYMLAKPGIVFGNAITAAGAFALGAGGYIDLWDLSVTLFGLCLIVASGCVLNNYLDRVGDRKMERTRTRALARGTISEKRAFIFGLTLLALGGLVLASFTNWLATFIALFGFVVYVGFYTVWKYRTVYGTEIGSIAGAVPPVVGYCSASGQFDLAASLLFSIVALWQMPHFFAIALYRMKEYASASIPVFPLKRGSYATKLRMLFYLSVFLIASMLLTVFGYTGYWYLAAMLILGLGWLWLCVRGFRSADERGWARQMFLSSLVVILGFCAMLFLDRQTTKLHLVLHFDMNQTLIATDRAGQKAAHDAIAAGIADRVVDYWDDSMSFPISYADYVKGYLLPNPNHSKEIKLEQKEKISEILTLLEEKNHPAYPQIKELYAQATEHLKSQKTQIFPSFYKLIEFLQKENISYTLIIRTFGSEGSDVASELNSYFGDNFINDFRMIKQGSLQETTSNLYEVISNLDHHLVIQDDWEWWFEHGQHWEYGKPFPIDVNDSSRISLFFDDHANVNPLFPTENIVFPYNPKRNHSIHPKELIHQNRLFPVEMLDALCDEDYYIRSVKRAMNL